MLVLRHVVVDAHAAQPSRTLRRRRPRRRESDPPRRRSDPRSEPTHTLPRLSACSTQMRARAQALRIPRIVPVDGQPPDALVDVLQPALAAQPQSTAPVVEDRVDEAQRPAPG